MLMCFFIKCMFQCTMHNSLHHSQIFKFQCVFFFPLVFRRNFASKSFLRSSSNKKGTLTRSGRPASAKTMRKEKYLLPHEPLTMQRPPAASSTLPRNMMSGSLESVATEATNSRPNSMLMYEDEDLSSEYICKVIACFFLLMIKISIDVLMSHHDSSFPRVVL